MNVRGFEFPVLPYWCALLQVRSSVDKPSWVGDRIWLSINKLGLNAFALNSKKSMLDKPLSLSKRLCLCVACSLTINVGVSYVWVTVPIAAELEKMKTKRSLFQKI
jgi:hypothetical protein